MCDPGPSSYPTWFSCYQEPQKHQPVTDIRGRIYNRIAGVLLYKNKMNNPSKMINIMWITISYSNI